MLNTHTNILLVPKVGFGMMNTPTLSSAKLISSWWLSTHSLQTCVSGWYSATLHMFRLFSVTHLLTHCSSEYGCNTVWLVTTPFPARNVVADFWILAEEEAIVQTRKKAMTSGFLFENNIFQTHKVKSLFKTLRFWLCSKPLHNPQRYISGIGISFHYGIRWMSWNKPWHLIIVRYPCILHLFIQQIVSSCAKQIWIFTFVEIDVNI